MINESFEERDISIPIYDETGQYRTRLKYRTLTEYTIYPHKALLGFVPSLRHKIHISLSIVQQDLENFATGYKYVGRRHHHPKMAGEEWGIDYDALEIQIARHKEFLKHPLFYLD